MSVAKQLLGLRRKLVYSGLFAACGSLFSRLFNVEMGCWFRRPRRRNQQPISTLNFLQDILGNGPEFGIHTLTWCDTLSGLDNVLGANMLRHFDVRVAFPTSSREEILNLVERSNLPALGSGQALYYNRDEMRLEKFRPFQLPSKEWLQQAAAFIQRKGEANM